MRISKHDIPTKIDVPGATARQLPDFGTADGPLGAEFFSLGAGLDISPLLQGLHDDACQSPHWGYVISGTIVVTYTDDTLINTQVRSPLCGVYSTERPFRLLPSADRHARPL